MSLSAPIPDPETARLRSRFHPNDRVRFAYRGRPVEGAISRLNPKTARIVCDDDREFNVPYPLLESVTKHAERKELRSEEEVKEISVEAERLLNEHGLGDWSFAFDYSIRRAGSCNYSRKLITISYDFARHASDADVRDTILHEIAHALVGPKHNHDRVWQATAKRIGCSGKRCHDVQFAPPRYIVKCSKNCWSARANRRRRGICKVCRSPIEYMTYTDERWERESKSAVGDSA